MQDFLLPLLVDTADGRKHFIHRNMLHAQVVAAGCDPLIEGIHARAARQCRPDEVAARRPGSANGRCFRAEQRDDVDGGQAGVVCRATVAGDQDLG